MENQKAVFVKHLGTNNIVVITDTTRHYFERISKVNPLYILLDQYEQVIGQVEFTPKEAEVYVEQKLVELQEKHDKLLAKEAELIERENALSGDVKIDKRSKEYKDLKKTK